MNAAVSADKFAAEKLSDGTYGLSDERLGWHLDNWARWESSNWNKWLAYTMSDGVSSSEDFDTLCLRMDYDCASKTQAAIESLTPAESCAVFNKMIGSVFRFREPLEAAWTRARWKLKKDLYRRGLV